MDSAFRDDRQALRLRLEALERRIAEHTLGLTELFWKTLDPRLRAELDALRPRRHARLLSSLSHEVLVAAVAAAERYEALLSEAVSALPAREDAWRTLSDAPPTEVAGQVHTVSLDAVDYVMHQTALTTRGQKLDAIFEAMPTAALRSKTIDPAWRWELVADGVPLRATLGIHHAVPSQRGEMQVTLTTSVSRRTAPIALSPERWTDVLMRTVGLRQDVTLGDPEFDSFFLVQGPLPALRVLLTGAVRRSLLRIAREDVPWLTTQGEAASITWSYTPSHASVTSAIRVLASIRNAPPTLNFREGR